MDKHWQDYEIQRPDGSWTTVEDLVSQELQKEREKVIEINWRKQRRTAIDWVLAIIPLCSNNMNILKENLEKELVKLGEDNEI